MGKFGGHPDKDIVRWTLEGTPANIEVPMGNVWDGILPRMDDEALISTDEVTIDCANFSNTELCGFFQIYNATACNKVIQTVPKQFACIW